MRFTRLAKSRGGPRSSRNEPLSPRSPASRLLGLHRLPDQDWLRAATQFLVGRGAGDDALADGRVETGDAAAVPGDDFAVGPHRLVIIFPRGLGCVIPGAG